MSEAKELVEMIRSALADDADDILRRRAVKACDQLLAVLTAEPGQPMPVPPAPPMASQPNPAVAPAAPAPPQPAFSPAMQMLDALIAKLRSELPKEKQPAESGPSKRLRIPFVPIPGRLLGS